VGFGGGDARMASDWLWGVWWWVADVGSVIIQAYPESNAGNKSIIFSLLIPKPGNALANKEPRIWIRSLITLGI